jgi:hypothetical protein
MCEKVPLLKLNDPRRGPAAIQCEFHRPEGGTGMLLSDGDLRTGSTNTCCSDGVLPGRRHHLRTAKAPEGAVHRPHVGKEDWLRQCLKEPVQLIVVLSLLFQYLGIAVWVRSTCCRRRVSCWCVNGSGASC